MTYQEVLDFLYSQLPIFQRIGPAAYKADLSNTVALCKLLGNPENKFKSIHIAGTNGKGSCSHALASIFQEAGYKTGLYTSPHLKDFRERIRINGKMITKQKVIDFVVNHKEGFLPIKPSFFEITVGMAFEYFAEEKVDIAILETGLGGRLDSTNVVTPELSVITNIGTDHTNFLGDSYPQIATEKAGIIKKNIAVVIGETHTETKDVFIKKAKAENAPIYFADQQVEMQNAKYLPAQATMCFDVLFNGDMLFQDMQTDLFGNYQIKNLKTVLLASLLLKEKFNLNNKAIAQGVEKVKTNTGFAGRWQIIAQSPLTIADTGHNKEGVQKVLEQINSIQYEQLHFVLGMVNDKNIDGVLELLPKNAIYYFCKADIPRGMPAADLQSKCAGKGLKGKIHSSVAEALQKAQTNATNNDLVFVGGSTFTVAEIL